MIIIPSNTAALAPPTIVSFSPSGLTGGGQVSSNVTITGTNFTSGTTATVNGSSCSVTYVSTTQITVSFPPLGAGTYTVTVTTAGGSASANYSYAVPAPTIGSVDPPQGTTGSTITVYGSNLSGASVSIGGTSVSASGNSGVLVFTCPAFGSDGGVTISVSTAGGTATASFTYYAPRSAETTTYTSGSGSYTPPAWATYVDIICIGGGASGDGFQPPQGSANRKGGNAGSWGAGTVSAGGAISYTVGSGGVAPPYNASNPNTTGSKAVTQPGAASSAGGVTGSGGSGNTADMYGGSPGNYTYNGVTYIGAVSDRTVGASPGAGGGAAITGNGYSGGSGQVWFVARQT